MTTQALGNETHVIRRNVWQAYGYYASREGRPMFASAVRASNPFMARLAVLSRTWDAGPVITYLEPITPRERI